MRLPFHGSFAQTQDWNDARFRESYKKFNMLGHNGEDYSLPSGTPVLAPHGGKILEALFDSGYGNYVKIQDDLQASVLAHLSRFDVQVGQVVTEGQQIGLSGNTGNSTGPHLHWGYFRVKTRNRNNGFLGYIDQSDWMTIGTENVDALTGKIKKLEEEKNGLWQDKQRMFAAITVARDGLNKVFA